MLYSIALDLPDLAKILLSKGATIPPFMSESEFNSRIKSADMKRVIQQFALDKFSFLDAFSLLNALSYLLIYSFPFSPVFI